MCSSPIFVIASLLFLESRMASSCSVTLSFLSLSYMYDQFGSPSWNGRSCATATTHCTSVVNSSPRQQWISSCSIVECWGLSLVTSSTVLHSAAACTEFELLVVFEPGGACSHMHVWRTRLRIVGRMTLVGYLLLKRQTNGLLIS